MSLIKNSKSYFRVYFFEVIFGGNLFPIKRPSHIFKKGYSDALTDLHPLAVTSGGNIAIKGGVDFYITPELYERKHSIFKKVLEIPPKNITKSELDDLRRELNDNDFTVSKLYGFRNVKAYSIYPILSIDDFDMPDFNVKITVKKEKEKIDDNIKKIFEGSFYVLDNKVNTSKKTEILSETKRSASIKNTSPEKLEEYLGGQYHQLKKLTEEVDLKSLNRVYEKKILYDLENIIKPSFTTELQKEFSIYGLVNFFGEIDEDKKLKVISPKNSLKFELEKDI